MSAAQRATFRHAAAPVRAVIRGTNIVRRLAHLAKPVLRRPDHLQVAALCLRRRGNRREVLLISTRRSGRWTLPKGWPMKKRSLADAALQEAWEEAGVIGSVAQHSIGCFHYRKGTGGGLGIRCRVEIFPIEVAELADTFPEADQRRRRWVSPTRAERMVHEHELRALLHQL